MLFLHAKIALLLLGCFLLASFTKAHAQFQIEFWTTDNGLPQNTIHSIVQTPDGYLWLATLDGLVRYDGVKFTVFNKNNTNGIESNRFTKLLLDKEGDLWIGTENRSVTRYHQGTFQTYNVGDNLHDYSIWNLVLNNLGELIAFTDGGIIQWNGEQFVPYVPIARETQKSSVLWSKTGGFWYSNGSDFYCLKDGSLKTYKLPKTEQNSTVNGFFEDSRGRLWIGTIKAGLFLLENEKLTAYTIKNGIPDNEISAKLEDRNGNIWCITRGGAAIISPENKISVVTVEQGLSENSLSSIFEDKEGNIWLGTYLRGLNRLSRQSITFYTRDNGLGSESIYPIYQDHDDNIWSGGGLTRYAAGKFNKVIGRGKFLNVVTAIEQDRSGRLWFGFWNGAYYYEKGKFTDFTDRLGMKATVLDIHEDRTGGLWFASNAGVFEKQPDGRINHYTKNDGLISNDVKVIHESPDGTLWFGTYGGLTQFKNGVFSSFTTNEGLASNLVRSLYEDTDSVLWIGSYDGGLTRLKDGKFTRFTSNDGLFNDGVFQILEDDRANLWMSSNRGIYRVSKQQLDDFANGRISRLTSTVFGKADGLLETECNGGQQPAGIKVRDGKLWFPTQRGIAVIDPDKVITNSFAPPVLIESVLLNGVAALTPLNAIRISSNIENLEINYTGLSFLKSGQVRFRYKMTGLDSEWIEADARRTAYYSHLPPGEYTFTVIAANSDGIWNTEGASIQVRVIPPFYRTWWFSFLLFVIIAGAAFLFYRQRIARLEQARKAQENFSRQLLASQELERQRIAAELHDSIGQSLLIIKNRAYLALNDFEEREIVREQLEELSQSASGAIEECREISYNLRPYQIAQLGLTNTLGAIFRRISEVMEIDVTVEIDTVDDIFSAEAETNIYRIIQESCNNILKHSLATEAGLIVKHVGHEIEICIHDNGCGFDRTSVKVTSDRRNGFGLIGMAERIRLLDGRFEIESNSEDGTRINIKLSISPINERNKNNNR